MVSAFCISSKVATETFFHQEALTQPASQNVEDLSRPEETDFRNWAAGRVRAYKAVFSGKFGSPMAVLEIPRIPLAVPLLEGTDELTLNHAVGHIAGTARPGEPGNIGIAGHRDGFFRGLQNLKPGDAIELRTAHGTDTYEVGQIQIVTPDNVAVLRARPLSSLTLVTCYPFYFIGSAPKRFVVTAYLTKRNSAGPTTSETRKTPLTSSLTKEQQ